MTFQRDVSPVICSSCKPQSICYSNNLSPTSIYIGIPIDVIPTQTNVCHASITSSNDILRDVSPTICSLCELYPNMVFKSDVNSVIYSPCKLYPNLTFQRDVIQHRFMK